MLNEFFSSRSTLIFITVISVHAIIVSGAFAADQKTRTNSIGMDFVLIQAGSFMMGAHDFEKGGENEKPRHKVTISKPYYIGKYEVTQEQWMKVMGNNPSGFQGQIRPVENVSWDDAQEFIRKLNQKEATNKYRLPTEAEWEYAARAGSDTVYCYGNDPDAKKLHQYACYVKNSGNKTKPVGKLKPNAWGVHDMHGNVWEWVRDWFDMKYSISPSTDPTGITPEVKTGWPRVYRGGSWQSSPKNCRSANRNGRKPDYRDTSVGFRLALSPGQ